MRRTETLALLGIGLLRAQEGTRAEGRAILVEAHGALHKVEDRDEVVLGIRGGGEGLEGVGTPARRVRRVRDGLDLALQESAGRREEVPRFAHSVGAGIALTCRRAHRLREGMHENLGAPLEHKLEGLDRSERDEPDRDIDEPEQEPQHHQHPASAPYGQRRDTAHKTELCTLFSRKWRQHIIRARSSAGSFAPPLPAGGGGAAASPHESEEKSHA